MQLLIVVVMCLQETASFQTTTTRTACTSLAFRRRNSQRYEQPIISSPSRTSTLPVFPCFPRYATTKLESNVEQNNRQDKDDDGALTETVSKSLLQEDDDEKEGEELTVPIPMDDEMTTMKNIMLLLCWGVALLSALDRVAMSVAMVPLSAELGYTDTMKGSVSSLFSVGYGLGIVPAGILVATASPRVVMACGIAVWSIATIATPQAAAYSSMIPLLLARASVGAAESVVLPTLQTLLSSWTTRENKSRSLATVFSGFHAGTVAAYLLSPLVIDYTGDWRSIFTLYGGIGLFWLIPWFIFSSDSPQQAAVEFNSTVVVDVLPPAKKRDVRDQKNGIDVMSEFAKAIETLKEAPWADFIRSKGAWAMLAAHAANNWGLYNTLAWSPTFYSEHYGLNVRDSALYSILPSVAGALGGLVAGSLADAALQSIDEEKDQEKRDEATTKVRKGFQGLALFVPAMALFTLSNHLPDEPFVAQLLLMGTTGFQAFNAAGYLAANQEKSGPKWAGLLYSITSLPAVMVGTLGVYLTGQILDVTHQDWASVFALNGCINLLGALAFVSLYDSKREFD